MAHRAIIIVGVAALGLHGCGNSTAVARDVTVDTTPIGLNFVPPLPAPTGRYSLCLEFEIPGDSRAASAMTVIMRDSAGIVDTLRGTPDRTGESTICWHDSTSRPMAGVTLTAPRRIMIRHVGWRARTR